MELTFDRLELDRIRAALTEETLKASPDIHKVLALDGRRKSLTKRIDEIQKQFALHHSADA